MTLSFVTTRTHAWHGRRWRALASVCLALACTACFSNTRPSTPPPAWIDHPGDGVSASAGFHVQGVRAQEALAIARAREEFGKRFGVRVSSEQVIEQQATARSATVRATSTTTEAMRDNEVRAQVKEKWQDPETGVLWVWLVPAP
jgi:hypothetical protein